MDEDDELKPVDVCGIKVFMEMFDRVRAWVDPDVEVVSPPYAELFEDLREVQDG